MSAADPLKAVPEDFRGALGDASITLSYRGWSTASQNRHFHRGWEVLLVCSGEREMFLDGTVCPMEAGDLLLIPPDYLHKSLAGGGSEIYSLQVLPSSESEKRVLERSLGTWRGEAPARFRTEGASLGRIRGHFSSLREELSLREPGFEVASKSLAWAILVEVERLPAENAERAPRDGREIHRRMLTAASWMAAHCSENLSLPALAKRFYLSESYLSRAFRRETGFGLSEYAANVRVLEARRLLSGGRDRIGDIAAACGFGSVSSFNRVFRGLTGQSPGEYRKSSRS